MVRDNFALAFSVGVRVKNVRVVRVTNGVRYISGLPLVRCAPGRILGQTAHKSMHTV